MTSFQFFDFFYKKLNSFLFRIILIFYSIILLLFNNNYFDFYFYLVFIVIYFLIFINLINKSHLRLINDFFFIFIVLYQKSPSEIFSYTFLLLPIINSINYSGFKKNLYVYFYTVILFVLLDYIYSKPTTFDYKPYLHLISLVFLYFINRYTEYRLHLRDYRELLIATVDEFYLNREQLKKPHKIYKNLINAISTKSNLISIIDIVCFTVINDTSEKIVIVNGSTFFWNFNLEINSDFLISLRTKKNLKNVKIRLDDKLNEYNIVLYSKVEDQEYIYFLLLEKPLPFIYNLNIDNFSNTLEPVFKKISTILLSEKRLLELRNEQILNLSERIQYVIRANKAMHFIRNKLGPFANLIKMLTDYDSITPEKQVSLKVLIDKEVANAQHELIRITSRASDILEKSKNPFDYSSVDNFPIKSVFTLIKRNYLSFFDDTNISINTKLLKPDSFVTLNEEGFELFLTDWFSNMSKYNKGHVEFIFTVLDGILEITFVNNHGLDNQDLGKIITDFQSDNRNEIMKRKTHGLFNIKHTLEDMSIPFEVYSSDNDTLLNFKIRLKTY